MSYFVSLGIEASLLRSGETLELEANGRKSPSEMIKSVHGMMLIKSTSLVMPSPLWITESV